MSIDCKEKRNHMEKRCRKGDRPSSYSMQDPLDVFEAIQLKKNDVFIDLGCGAGEYSKMASQILADSGKVYALDCNQHSVDALKHELLEEKIENIEVLLANLVEKIPLNDNFGDVCLIATVLHALPKNRLKDIAQEVCRIIRPGGRLVTIDCSKKDTSFGPPITMRLDPSEIIAIMTSVGFEVELQRDLGFNYLISMRKL